MKEYIPILAFNSTGSDKAVVYENSDYLEKFMCNDYGSDGFNM